MRLQRCEQALADAVVCTNLQPGWAKGHARRGAALFGLGQFRDSVQAYQVGLELQPGNEQMRSAMEEAQTRISD